MDEGDVGTKRKNLNFLTVATLIARNAYEDTMEPVLCGQAVRFLLLR
jgi:hypothetical protein